MKKFLLVARGYLPDWLMLSGMAGVSHGAALIYPPAGWIVAGAFSLALGVLLARRGELG